MDITISIEDLAKLQASASLATSEIFGMPVSPEILKGAYKACLNDLKQHGYEKQLHHFNSLVNVQSN